MQLAPDGAWQGAHCSYGLVVTVLQAAEDSLRQAGLHRSAADFEMLRITFLHLRQRDVTTDINPPGVTVLPRRLSTPRQHRRIPGLHRCA